MNKSTHKQLVWEELGHGVSKAVSVFGDYYTWDGKYWLTPGFSGGALAEDPKAAAQADYDARGVAAPS